MASTGGRRSRLRSGPAATVVAGVVVAILSGCATLPSENTPHEVTTGGNAVQAYPRPLPPPPPQSGLYKSPSDTVLGFLAASASYAYDPGLAREFLSPAVRKKWKPGPVTVVSSLSQPTTQPAPAESLTCRGQQAACTQSGGGTSNPVVQYKSVKFSAQDLATLSQGGQYEYSARTTVYRFDLAKRKNGIWLITRLPQGDLHTLWLTQASFPYVYQPRNLFFFAHVNGELVPDPVYAPEQSADSAFNTDVAAGLVKGLLKDENSWLSAATTTAFPSGTKLLKVTLRGRVAIVDLGGTAARASGPQKYQMQAQLQATLASNAYSSPLAESVVLKFNGKSQFPGAIANLVSPVSTGPWVYQSGPSEVGQGYSSSDIAETGTAEITALAATTSGPGSYNASTTSGGSGKPVPATAIAVQNRGGCAIELNLPPAAAGDSPRHPTVPLSASGGPCTSLSWDRDGNLWAVAGGHVVMLPTQAGKLVPVPVSSPKNLTPDGKSGPRILSLQMAPDGIRVALLVGTPGLNNNRVLLAAVSVKQHEVSLGNPVPAWTGLPNPEALSWYSAYYLVALTKIGIWQVPLTGGPGRFFASVPARAVSLTTDGVTLVVGTASSAQGPGRVYQSDTEGNSWIEKAFGAFPAYASLAFPAGSSGCRNGGAPADIQRDCG